MHELDDLESPGVYGDAGIFRKDVLGRDTDGKVCRPALQERNLVDGLNNAVTPRLLIGVGDADDASRIRARGWRSRPLLPFKIVLVAVNRYVSIVYLWIAPSNPV
jgi:hypothetical protein